MRGTLFEMAYTPKNVGNLNADDFACTKDGHEFAEWYENNDDNTCFEAFKETFSKFGAAFGNEDGTCYISFTAEAKQAVFANRYERFMKEAGSMTPEKFASGGIQECQRLIENTYGDAVYLVDEEYAVTMDEFIRRAEPGERFYIGNILLMY